MARLLAYLFILFYLSVFFSKTLPSYLHVDKISLPVVWQIPNSFAEDARVLCSSSTMIINFLRICGYCKRYLKGILVVYSLLWVFWGLFLALFSLHNYLIITSELPTCLMRKCKISIKIGYVLGLASCNYDYNIDIQRFRLIYCAILILRAIWIKIWFFKCGTLYLASAFMN